MTLSKDEFKTLVMLYAANIDGNIQLEEVKMMVETLFEKKSDLEILECIR